MYLSARQLAGLGGLPRTARFHFVALLFPLEKLWKTSRARKTPEVWASLVVQLLNFAEDTKFLPAQLVTRGCREPRVDFSARKVHAFLCLSFPLTRSADHSKWDGAPLDLRSRDYTLLFRFPSQTFSANYQLQESD